MTGVRIRALLVVVVVAVVGAVVANRYPSLRADPIGTLLSSSTTGVNQDQPSRDDVTDKEVAGLLAVVDTVRDLPSASGYERSCGRDKGCVFGQAWTDDTDAPMSHDGCDTRNNILATQLSDVTFKPGTKGCKVASGTLTPDPYTGRTIALDHHGSVSTITIDHVFALERAWNLGASTWTPARRATFANDPANLLAVDASTNSSKGSDGLDWLPANAGFQCTYIARYLDVAHEYHLPITRDDKQVATRLCT